MSGILKSAAKLILLNPGITVLVLHVIDLGLEMLDFLVKLEDGLSDVLCVQLVVTGKFRYHGVIGIESTFHHTLSLEDLLIHCFESCLHAPGLLWPLNIPNVKHPLMHVNGLRVLHHLRKVGVDDLLVELVLGGAWRRHDDLDLSEK